MPGRYIKKIWPSDPARDAPARHRRACSYETFVPDPLASTAITLDGRLSGSVSEAEHEIRNLNELGGAALTPLARLLLRTESITSSKVEGLQLGVRELARAEAKSESGVPPGPTALEVLANIDAMTLAMDEATETADFGIQSIRAIHRRLLEGTRSRRIAGMIRTGQNWIGGNDYTPCGADFVPPPPEELDRLLSDLGAAISDETSAPLIQAALVHAQFETIHPFDDGNGRTGRALIHVVLRRRGVAPRFVPPLSVVFAKRRAQYIAGLTAFRKGDITEWLALFAAAMTEAARLGVRYLAEVRALQQRWRTQLRAIPSAPREGAAAWKLIDLLPAHPIVSGPVAAALTARAKPRVYLALDQLVEAGVLLPLTRGKRNRWWEADGLLGLIERMEEGG